MANTIIVKRSSVAGKAPTAGDLQVGELAVNLADQKIYSKNAAGTVVQLGGGAGSGDVVGPSSATDNALVRFDGATGKLIQNSLGVLDDSGNLDVTSAKADYFDLDTAAAAPANAVGREAWDDGAGAPIVGLKGGVVTYYYGQQEFARVYNGSGAAMTKGQVVYIVGAQGNRVDVRLAQANAESTSANTIGLVAEPIANGAEGWVQTNGPLPKLDTSTLTAGQAIYLSPTTAGAYTTTKPTAPNHLVVLGFVERVDATVGSIFLKVDNGYELDELHNVNISSPTGGQLLAYDQTAGYWKNIALTDGTGVSITETTAGAVTIGLATAYGDTENPYASKTANYFLAAPNGAAGAPTFRAVVAADIPTLNQNTTGSAAKWTTARTLSFTGDATGSGSVDGSADVATTLTLANTAVTAGSYTYSSITVDSKGRITAASSGTAPTTYSAATTTNLGLIKLGSDTTQTVAANAVTATASRSYAVQVDASGQALVNVPWTDTASGGTVTSVSGTGTVAGISLSGTVTTSGNLTLGGTFALPSGQVPDKMVYDTFTATASQTVFTTSATYTSGKIEVYVNGVKIRNGTDVTVTAGTSVTMASGLPVGTLVDLVYPI